MNTNKTTAKVIYEGALRTLATHTYSGDQIETDAPLDNEGLAQRFSPTDLVATSLASCMLTIMGIKARQMDIDLKGTECKVYKTMQSDPRRISQIKIVITLPSDQIFERKTRIILENSAMTCPVAKSLHPDVHKDVSFIWAESV